VQVSREIVTPHPNPLPLREGAHRTCPANIHSPADGLENFHGRTARMSILVELPERLYHRDAFAAFEPVADFKFGTARAMAWMAQLAYETGDPDKIKRVCDLWGLRDPRVIASATSRRPPFIRTRGIVAEGHGATIFA